MFSRICNLCQKATNTQFMKLQRCYKKTSKSRRKNVIMPPQNVEGKTPIIVCKRKDFNFYEGQKYSKYEPIPLASKGWAHYKSKGDHFFIHPLTNIKEESYDNTDIESFSQFDLDPQLVDTLEKYGITKPLKIQATAIPKILSGVNSIIAAETGCGKTLAYLVPMINRILTWKTLKERSYNSPLGLIVTPSRELAFQLGLEARKICQHLGIYTKTLIGGKTKKIMLDPPVGEVDIVIASFGVISKLTTTKIYKLDMVKHLVLDEADALFDESFEEKLQVFLKRVPLGFMQEACSTELPKTSQFTLVSATMPSRMSEVLNEIINVDSLEHITSEKLHQIFVLQKFMRIGKAEKPMELLKYIKPKVARKEPVIIFNNNNATCNWVSMFLNNSNIQTVSLNGDMPMYERHGKYATFKSGKCNVLCTTNAGSRGLNTISVRHVLNYEFPTATADYIHRCGRTGRVGSADDCRVTNFISAPSEIAMVWKIERAIRKMKPIPIFNVYENKENDNSNYPFNINEAISEDSIIEEEEIEQQEFSAPY